MSLLDKSKEFKKAGNILLMKGLYASSIHCFYYSTFVYMKHHLAHSVRQPISLLIQDAPRNASHKFVFDKFKLNIRKNKTLTTFENLYNDIVTKRIEADYSNVVITADYANEMKTNSYELKKIIGGIR